MRDVIKIMDWVSHMSKIGRERQKGFIGHVLEMMRASLLINYKHTEGLRLAGEDKAFAANFAPFVHSGNCREMIAELNASYYGVERNANARILFLDLSLKMSQLLRKKELYNIDPETQKTNSI